MEFDNAFDVPLPPAEAWAVLMDVERIAPCLPGAELDEILDPRSFKGRVAVRLGPVSLSFAGTARFAEIDPAARTARIVATGSDAKGRGGAQATVRFALEPAAAGSQVRVHTDLALSGAVAQYGRGAGMIQEVASQLIRQFAQSLANDLAQRQAEPAAAVPTAASEAPAPPHPAAARPISGLSLLVRALWASLLRLVSGRSAAS